MTLQRKASPVNMAMTFSIACCAEKYHCLGSLAEGFIPLAHSNAALPNAERESRTKMVSSPHSAGVLSSSHLSRYLSALTNAFGAPFTTGPIGEDLYSSRTVTYPTLERSHCCCRAC